MALCVYKRIRSEPVRLTIDGKTVVVRHGETVITDNKNMMGVSGFAFLRIYDQQDSFRPAQTNLVISRPPPMIESIDTSVTEISVQEINTSTIEKSPLKEVKPPQPVITESPKQIGFKTDVITKLKSFDNKQWFALKKEEIIKFLEDANIEYKHISSDKWELLKFLKKIIKEL